MVFYFSSTATEPQSALYMGKDKVENEDLIRFGHPEDIWFHVDRLSSAHVYIRIAEGERPGDVPADLVEDCGQLVKANSKEGCKLTDVDVVYTPWTNLKKTGDMAVGQVGFHNEKLVKRVKIVKNNAIINRLNKTKKESYPDLHQQRLERDAREVAKNKKALKIKMEEAKALGIEEEKKKKNKHFVGLFDESKMQSNQYAGDVDVDAFEEDFM
eukprot:CFRG6992T1